MTIARNCADKVIFYHISWRQFENILENLGESGAARMAYDHGTLETITP